MDSPYLTVIESCDFPDIEIRCSESVTFGETARNKMDKKKKDLERECVLSGVCALLNSGGGVLPLAIANKKYDYTREGRGLDIEQDLKKLVCPQRWEDMIEIIPQSDKVCFYVRSWHPGNDSPRLCSINTGLWERSGSANVCICPSALPEFLKKKKDMAESDQDNSPPKAKRYAPYPGNDTIRNQATEFYNRKIPVNLGECLGFGESMHVELKQFGSEKLITRLREVVPKNISAFANTDGGFMFIGVNDKSQEVTGCGKGLKAEELLKMVGEVCRKYEAVHCFGCSEVDVSWSPECKLITAISQKSAEADGYVVAIKIPAFCCAVFEKPPNSWHIEDGKVCRLTADAWLKKVQLSDPVYDLSERFENVLSLQDAPPQCKPVYSIQKLTHLQEKLFPVSRDSISVVPEAFKTKPFTSVVLTANSVKSKGICIFSQSWAVDLNIHKNENVICEALLISKGSYPTLCCVVERASPELWKYATDTACHLKQKLVNLGGYTGKLCVIPQLVETQGTSEMSELQTYPNSYILKQRGVKALLHSLVIVVMSFTSLWSDEVGCEFLNLLTAEQFEILQTYDQINKLFIHGVPGSGKTLIAIELIKRIKNAHHCEKNNILYLCENVGLRDFMRKQDLCQCETRVKFLDEHMDFSAVKHIIVDEAQNFSVKRGEDSWYKKALQLRAEDGMFWIFLDNNQKCHSFPNGLPALPRQNKATLHKVVRNSVEVVRAMQSQMARITTKGSQSRPITQHLAKINRKMELTHSFQGVYSKVISGPNKEVHRVSQILKSLFDKGHSPGDVAVLFSTKEQLDTVQFKLINTCPFPSCSVEEIDPSKMVVDTVRRFSGLERNIVILVNASVHPFHAKFKANFLVSAYSRARIRLYDVKSHR